MKVSIEMPADLGYSFELKEGAEQILSELVYDMIAANMNTMARHGLIDGDQDIYTSRDIERLLASGQQAFIFSIRAMTQEEMGTPLSVYNQ